MQVFSHQCEECAPQWLLGCGSNAPLTSDTEPLIARTLPASLPFLLILRLAELSSTCSALVPRLRIARLSQSGDPFTSRGADTSRGQRSIF
jgi:hypothetical protein